MATNQICLNIHDALHSSSSDRYIIDLINRNTNNVHARGKSNVTTLHLACKYTRIGVIYKLLAMGVDINELDSYGNNALTYAIFANSMTVLLILISNGININAPNMSGQTPIYCACHYKRIPLIIVMLHYGAVIDYKNKNDTTVLQLMCCANRGEFDIISTLLISLNGNCFAKNKYGKSAYEYAIDKGSDEIIQIFNSINDNVECRRDILLAMFSTLNHSSILKQQYIGNGTFLHIICSNYHYEHHKMQTLRQGDNGCINDTEMDQCDDYNSFVENINAKNKSIVFHHTYSIIKSLVQSNAIDINARNSFGQTALHLLSKKPLDVAEFSKCIQVLKEVGADFNVKDELGKTALHYAKDEQYFQILLNNGADIACVLEYGL